MAKTKPGEPLPGTEPSYPVVGNSDDIMTTHGGSTGNPAPVSTPLQSSTAAERHEDVKSPTPRRLSSPDVQSLARIDRILAKMQPEAAEAIIAFFSARYAAPYREVVRCLKNQNG